MNNRLKSALYAIMVLAFLFGFFNARHMPGGFDFQRLHVFLFNLCAGGFLIMYHAGGRAVTARSALFLAISLIFAASVFLNLYPAAIMAALLLGVIVETARMRRFAWFPRDFFTGSVPSSDKFLHSAMLCLSLGLVISAVMMTVKTYFGMPLPQKMGIDIFFLGFSFPVSLITMSVMFSYMEKPASRAVAVLHEVSFWTVNAGVIMFLVFIIAEWQVAQAVISVVLFVSVIMIFVLFARGARGLQQKSILVSGMVLLMMTAVTGIGYIIARYFEPPGQPATLSKFILVIHRYVSLFGWNQTGLIVIMRFEDFPLKLNSGKFIALHWITVAVLAPLGELFFPAGLAATLLYSAMLALAIYAGSRKKG